MDATTAYSALAIASAHHHQEKHKRLSLFPRTATPCAPDLPAPSEQNRFRGFPARSLATFVRSRASENVRKQVVMIVAVHGRVRGSHIEM